MKLTQIFDTSTDVDTDKRFDALVAIVSKAREAYGNTDVAITAPLANSAEGLQDLAMLTKKDKLAVAASAFRTIKANAVADSNAAEGVQLDKRLEEYIAINPVFANITDTVESDYL